MKVLNEYKDSHHYWEEYEKTGDIKFCPLCGEGDIWEDQGAGDCEVGVDYLCLSCNQSFNVPFVNEIKNGIAEQLRTGKVHEPTTKPGG